MSTRLPMIDWTPPWRAAAHDESAGLQVPLAREIGRCHPLAAFAAAMARDASEYEAS